MTKKPDEFKIRQVTVRNLKGYAACSAALIINMSAAVVAGIGAANCTGIHPDSGSACVPVPDKGRTPAATVSPSPGNTSITFFGCTTDNGPTATMITAWPAATHLPEPPSARSPWQ